VGPHSRGTEDTGETNSLLVDLEYDPALGHQVGEVITRIL